jgi:catalase
MLATLMLVDEALAKAVADGVGMNAPKAGIAQPNPADPANNILPANRSQALGFKDGKDERVSSKRIPLPGTSKALSMVLTAPKFVETRQVAILSVSLTPEVKALRDAIKAEGAVAHLVSPELELSLGEDWKSLKSTPSVMYDGVIVLASKKDYTDPEDLGHALKFVAQAFKHCKTVGATDSGHDVVHGATMGLDDGAPGVVRGKKLAKPFLEQLARHRHWDRADLVKALPA